MTAEFDQPHGTSPRPAAESSRWDGDLLELLIEVDSRIHHLMSCFIAAGDQAKSDIAAMIDNALAERAAQGDDLSHELAEARIQIDTARTAPSTRRPTAEAIALVNCVRSKIEADLAPIRKAVDQLHTIESTVGGLFTREGLSNDPFRARVTLLGLNSYTQAISLSHKIKDDFSIREVSIQSYQPGRLVLLITGLDETSIVRRIQLASDVPVTRLLEQTDSIVFQARD